MGNTSSANKISAQDKYSTWRWSKERYTDLPRAILDMKIQRDKLRQYQKRITVLTDREKAIAKECLAKGDVSKAKLALRRKKYQEGLIAKTDAQLAQLEQLTSDVEFALVQKDIVFGLQQGTSVLKEIHREMGGIENVEKLLGESEEARAYQEVRCTGPSPRPLTDVLCVNRKSARCLRTRCRTRTKTRSRTNSKRSKPRSTVPSFPIPPSSSPSSHPPRRRRWPRTGRSGGHESALLSKHRSPCWRSISWRTLGAFRRKLRAFERGVGVLDSADSRLCVYPCIHREECQGHIKTRFLSDDAAVRGEHPRGDKLRLHHDGSLTASASHYQA
jgi:hypothetical protein